VPEYTWNHTTLRALKVDPSITYLQVRYRYPDHMELVRRCARPSGRRSAAPGGDARERQGDVRRPADRAFTTPERLEEIVAMHEEMGCDDLQPAPLHAGGRRAADGRPMRGS
jgi:hypothetical protein